MNTSSKYFQYTPRKKKENLNVIKISLTRHYCFIVLSKREYRFQGKVCDIENGILCANISGDPLKRLVHQYVLEGLGDPFFRKEFVECTFFRIWFYTV